jgi:serine/threonine protein kinase
MAAPGSAEEFLGLVRKSGVVDEKRLDTYAQQLRASGAFPDEPGKFAGLMVRDGLLTHFQAEQFLLGKWRRFTIGKYKVLERLGSGGMGSVYLCEHKFMRRRVAVKVLPAAKAEDPASLERFYREARAAAALDHPNIVRAYDIDQDENLHFLVMEYVDGSSLQEIIKKSGPMAALRACHYIRQAAIGMQHAHEAGLVHRDIKPGNLLVDRSGTVKVLDMGLARFFHDEEDILTKKYDESVLGTADYLAPEQALDSHGVDIRADIYSLGATFYFCLTGQPPFNEGTVAQKLIWHQTRQPKPIRTIRPEVPEQVAAVIDRMMAKDKTKRYQTPAQVADALAPFTTRPIPPPPEAEMPRLSPAAMAGMVSEASINMSPPSPVPQRAAPAATPAPRAIPAQHIAAVQAPVARSQAAQPTPDPRRVATPPPRPQPQARPAPNNGTPAPVRAEEHPNWGDMIANPAGARAAPKGSRSSTVQRRRLSLPQFKNLLAAVKKRPGFWAIVGVGGLLLLIGLIIVLSLVFGGKKNRAEVEPLPVIGRKLLVCRDPAKIADGRSLREAVAKAQQGDRIVVADEWIEELLNLQKPPKDLVIEADSSLGKPVVWRPPPSLGTGQKVNQLIALTACDGLTLRGFHFFGQNGTNQLHDIVTLFGRCPGLRLEDASFQSFAGSAIKFFNSAGESGRPMTLRNLRMFGASRPDAVPIAIELSKRFGSSVSSMEHVRIEDCRFEGPARAGLQVGLEASTEIAGLEVIHNRFFKSGDGVVLKRPPSGRPAARLTIDANTWCDLPHGVHLETLPAGDKGQIVIRNNLFVRTGLLVQLDEDAALAPLKAAKESPAQQIWFDEGDPLKEAPVGDVFFRKTFQVPKEGVSNAILDITCDDAFTVWINGKAWQSPRVQDLKRIHTFDVTPFLKPNAANLVAVQGTNTGGPAWLFAQLSADVAGKRQVLAATDSSWKTTRDPMEGWIEPAFKDDAWKPAKALHDYKNSGLDKVPWPSVIQEQLRAAAAKIIPVEPGNCRDAASKEGPLVNIGAKVVDTAALGTDPNDNATFLRYPKGNALSTAGADGKPVGVPPVD